MRACNGDPSPAIATRPRIFGCACVESYAGVLAKRPRVGQQLQRDVESARRLERAAIDKRVSARNLRHVDAAQVHSHPVSGLDGSFGPAVHLHAADFGLEPLR